MSMEFANETAISKEQILPPCVKAVKSLVQSRLALSFGIVMFFIFLILSAEDFAAGVILLPLGVFMLIAHIITYNKAKSGSKNFGISILSVAYLLPVFIQCVFSVWEELFYYAGKPSLFDYLRELSFDLPKPFSVLINCCDFDTELIFSIMAIIFSFIEFALLSLLTVNRNNTPQSLSPFICFVFVFLLTSVTFGWELIDIILDFLPEFSESSYDAIVLQCASLVTVLLLIAYSTLVCIYIMKIFVKMKRIKNVIQK